MTALARRLGVPVLLVSLGAAGLVPAAAAAPPAEPDTAAVRSTCIGPGRVAMTVAPSDTAGSVDLELRATGLPDGTRWQGDLSAMSETDEDSREFRRVAVDGGWTVRATLAEAGREGAYFGVAFSRRTGTCLVGVVSPRPAVALSLCAARFIPMLLARYRPADDTMVVRFWGSSRPGSRWDIELRATTTESAQAVEASLVAGPRGVMRARATLRGVDDPRLRVVATGPAGGRCALHLDPVDVTAAPLPSPRALLDRARELNRTTR
jgi:hypothetical protein